MPLHSETALLLVLVLLAAGLAGAFARLLRLPVVPVQLLFGVLLAHGPTAVFDAPAAASLQPFLGVALAVTVLVTGARWRPQAAAACVAAPEMSMSGGPRPSDKPLLHLLAEVTLVPTLVGLALLLAGVPPQVALLFGLLALASAADVVEALARGCGPAGVRTGRVLGAVARGDSVVCIVLVLLAVLLLRAPFGPPQRVEGPALPLLLLSLALGVSLTLSAPGLLRVARTWLLRAHNLALATLGVYAGAVVATDALPRGLLLALLVCALRVLGKEAAARWTARRVRDAAPALPGLGAALAPAGLLCVGLLLCVRDEPALRDQRELLLAVGLCAAALDAVAGPWLARRALARAAALPPAEPTSSGTPAAADDTPTAR